MCRKPPAPQKDYDADTESESSQILEELARLARGLNITGRVRESTPIPRANPPIRGTSTNEGNQKEQAVGSRLSPVQEDGKEEEKEGTSVDVKGKGKEKEDKLAVKMGVDCEGKEQEDDMEVKMGIGGRGPKTPEGKGIEQKEGNRDDERDVGVSDEPSTPKRDRRRRKHGRRPETFTSDEFGSQDTFKKVIQTEKEDSSSKNQLSEESVGAGTGMSVVERSKTPKRDRKTLTNTKSKSQDTSNNFIEKEKDDSSSKNRRPETSVDANIEMGVGVVEGPTTPREKRNMSGEGGSGVQEGANMMSVSPFSNDSPVLRKRRGAMDLDATPPKRPRVADTPSPKTKTLMNLHKEYISKNSPHRPKSKEE